jgi:hypothetical protein
MLDVLSADCLLPPVAHRCHDAGMTELLTPTIQTDVQVMFFDTDCAAVVHNIAYLRFIEVARTLLAEQLGLGLVRMAETGVIPSWSAPRSTTENRPASVTSSWSMAGSIPSNARASGAPSRLSGPRTTHFS